MAGATDDTPRAKLSPDTPAPAHAHAEHRSTESPDGLSHIVREIRDELAQITARELELRQRERELGRRYRNLSEASRRAATEQPDVSRQSLARVAAELNAQAVDIAARQARVDEITEQLRTQLAARDQPRGGPAMPVPAVPLAASSPSRWPWRCTVLAVVVGVLGGLGWYLAHSPSYRATLRVQIVTADPATDEVLRLHRALLLDPRLLDNLPAESELAPAWQAACADGRVTVRTGEGEPVLWYSVTASDAETARRLAAAACTAYGQRLADTRGLAGAQPGYRHLARLRERLEKSLQAARQGQLEARAALAALPATSEPAEVGASVDQLEAELTEVTAALERGRTELAGLASQDAIEGHVAPTEIEQTLAHDTLYSEDQQEFRATALQYRTELAVALFQLDAPRKAVQKVLGQLAATLAEQRALEPPADVAAILDECQQAVSDAQTRFASFAGEWQSGVDSVQKMPISDDVAQLVAQQGQMAEAARRAADEATAVVDQVGARIERLNGGDGSTRRVVVAAVLKADHEALKTAAESFGGVAAKTTLAENMQLDAQDRKLRGLRMRLNGRREAVSQALQQAADRAAREQVTAQIGQTREQVRALERRREELVTELVAALRQWQAADAVARRQAEWQQRETEIAWLEARRGEMVGELADVPEAEAGGPRAEIGGPTVAAVAPGRLRNAAVAGVVAFAGSWLLGALMVARWPAGRARGPSADPGSG